MSQSPVPTWATGEVASIVLFKRPFRRDHCLLEEPRSPPLGGRPRRRRLPRRRRAERLLLELLALRGALATLCGRSAGTTLVGSGWTFWRTLSSPCRGSGPRCCPATCRVIGVVAWWSWTPTGVCGRDQPTARCRPEAAALQADVVARRLRLERGGARRPSREALRADGRPWCGRRHGPVIMAEVTSVYGRGGLSPSRGSGTDTAKAALRCVDDAQRAGLFVTGIEETAP